MASYIRSLQRKLKRRMKDVQLHILRSDGGMASSKVAEAYPVNLLMSGPAGGVVGYCASGKADTLARHLSDCFAK